MFIFGCLYSLNEGYLVAQFSHILVGLHIWKEEPGNSSIQFFLFNMVTDIFVLEFSFLGKCFVSSIDCMTTSFRT